MLTACGVNITKIYQNRCMRTSLLLLLLLLSGSLLLAAPIKG
jgi:hypothetical protein